MIYQYKIFLLKNLIIFLADNPDLEIRQSVIDNVEKMKKCGNFDYGYTFYECPNGDADIFLD